MLVQKVTPEIADNSSFSIRLDTSPQMHNLWHYHEELEIVLIEEGRGTCYIGDFINSFKEGDLILIGSNTAHYWLFDDEFLDGDNNFQIKVHVLHFRSSIFGSDFLNLAENKQIQNLLTNTRNSLKFNEYTYTQISSLFARLIQKSPFNPIISLLELLQKLAQCKPEKLISSEYANQSRLHELERLNKVFEYLRINFRNKITLNDVSELAGLTVNSFCRFFKANTGKTFIEFLIEIRINYASKLLVETFDSVKEISLKSGFNNSVSFHKKFKELKQLTPTDYRNRHRIY